MRERSRQQLDPVGSAESRLLWVLLAAGAAAYAVVMTIAGWPATDSAPLAIAGAALSVAAAGLAIAWTSSTRAPFTRQRHLAVHVVALAALAASVWARHDADFDLSTAFASFVIAGLIVAVSPYRPPVELIAVGVSVALIAGLVLLTAVQQTDPIVPALVLVITGITPIIVLTLGAATYTETIMRAIETTGRNRETDHTPEGDEAAQHDRVAAMTQDALPLLRRVLDGGTVTGRDRADAAQTAQTLRTMLVAEINRTWLDATQTTVPTSGFTVSDTESLARDLTPSRRTVLRALLAAFANEPGFTGGSITLTAQHDRNQISIEANFNATDYPTPPGHPLVSALLAVMRSVFTELESTRTQARVLVKFGYERE